MQIFFQSELFKISFWRLKKILLKHLNAEQRNILPQATVRLFVDDIYTQLNFIGNKFVLRPPWRGFKYDESSNIFTW